jgi:hypothetical protein
VTNFPERGARLARRDDRAYREYVRKEQRRQARGPQRGSRVGVEKGCPARKMSANFGLGTLNAELIWIPL